MQLLRQLPQAHEKPISKGYKAVITEAEGESGGRPVLLRAETVGGRHAGWGISGGTLLVAAPPAIVARWLAAGSLNRPGVWPPEQVVEPGPFFDELTQRGFTTRLSRTETVAQAAGQR